ncbi:hypothetical protein AB0C87_24915 [Actinomadura sp. NPDC048021]|uniref:hypothetical protein n=1 Tax=Actinomadura sp. NPDC048021 TaxID=3155385 RepID=UPI0033CCDEC9
MIRVKLTNTSGEQLDVNPAYFKALDTAKTEYRSIVTGEPNEVKTSMIDPGVNMKGVVHFTTKAKLVHLYFTDVAGQKLAEAAIK